jgi:WD40 repeat protein
MEGHRNCVLAMAVSRDGQLIASGDGDGKLIVWHGDTGELFLTQVIEAHSDRPGIYSLDFSPDGAELATSSRDNRTKLWSTQTWQVHGKPIRSDGPDIGDITCIRYSPSGELVAIATWTHIGIWNPRTRESIAKLEVSDGYALAWTPNGTRLLSGDMRYHVIREWDTTTWQQIGVPSTDHTSYVSAIATTLLALWSPQQTGPDPWTGHTSCIYALAVNSTGTLVASASDDHDVRLWRRSDGQTIAIFMHLDTVLGVAFSADGKHIFSGGFDKKISQWAVPEDALLEDTPEVGSHSFQCCNLSSRPRIRCQKLQKKNSRHPRQVRVALA